MQCSQSIEGIRRRRIVCVCVRDERTVEDDATSKSVRLRNLMMYIHTITYDTHVQCAAEAARLRLCGKCVLTRLLRRSFDPRLLGDGALECASKWNLFEYRALAAAASVKGKSAAQHKRKQTTSSSSLSLRWILFHVCARQQENYCHR